MKVNGEGDSSIGQGPLLASLSLRAHSHRRELGLIYVSIFVGSVALISEHEAIQGAGEITDIGNSDAVIIVSIFEVHVTALQDKRDVKQESNPSSAV
jgi:hypothetical protein